jgi:hypothetical protein
MLFHAAFIQGLTNASRTAPHPEMGGYGTGPGDRGVRFYYDWVRDHVGRYEYPLHIKTATMHANRLAPQAPVTDQAAGSGGNQP